MEAAGTKFSSETVTCLMCKTQLAEQCFILFYVYILIFSPVKEMGYIYSHARCGHWVSFLIASTAVIKNVHTSVDFSLVSIVRLSKLLVAGARQHACMHS